jgi:hypothetical protein
LNPTQIVSVILGIFLVLLGCVAFSVFYGSDWITVAQGVTGASVMVGMFACALGLIVIAMYGKD